MDRAIALEHEATTKKFEIFHEGNYDVIVNVTAADKDGVNALLKQVKNNLTSGKDPLAGWVTYKRHLRIKFDRETGPRYAAKTKWKDRFDFEHTRDTVKDHPYRFGLERQNRVYNSLLNEMSLSAQIRDLVVGDEAQDVVKKYEYLKIKFIEPLIGLIDKRAGKKTIIYKHVEDTGARPSPSLVKELERFFLSKWIYPRDIDAAQFLVSNSPEGAVLYLIDIEGYEKATRQQVDTLLVGSVSGKLYG